MRLGVLLLMCAYALFSRSELIAQGASVGDSTSVDMDRSISLPVPAIQPLSFEMPHRVVVFPGEVIALLTDVPHDSGYAPWHPTIPDADWIEFGEAFKSNWQAFGGRLVLVSDEAVVYEAPHEPGVAFLVWNNGVAEPIILMLVVPGEGESWDEEVQLPIERLRNSEGCYLPTSGGDSFRMFAVLPPGLRPPPQRIGGFTFVPTGKPLNSSLVGKPCTGPRINVRDKIFVLAPETFDWGTIRITPKLAATLWRLLGIELEAGTEVKVQGYRQTTRYMKLVDRYRCRDGVLEYCGGSVTTWLVIDVTASPGWVCHLDQRNCGRQRTQPVTVENLGSCE